MTTTAIQPGCLEARAHGVTRRRRPSPPGFDLVADDVEVLVELDVDLRAVVEGDLDLVVALFVADFGLGDATAAGVLEGGRTGLLEGSRR